LDSSLAVTPGKVRTLEEMGTGQWDRFRTGRLSIHRWPGSARWVAQRQKREPNVLLL